MGEEGASAAASSEPAFNGRSVLVTGAAQGLGRAVAELFVERGARVVIADLDAEAAASTAGDLGDSALAVGCDVRSSEDVRSAVETAVSAFGGLDVLVNNAGIEAVASVVDQDEDAFHDLLDVNVIGVFLCTKHAVPALSEGGGAIVNIASVAGVGGAPLLGAYCASKAAVIRFTEVCSAELRDAGIRVNAVCPAFVAGAMVDRIREPFEQVTGASLDELASARQGRLGRPGDVAEMVAFLASEDAAFITGAHYLLDGGLTAGVL